jgi:hypothetical protein
MVGKKADLAAEIADLYRLPFEQWTAARNALAARLRAAGRKADAEAVKALRKPSLSAWAVNQLFRSEGERMDELLAAGQRARAAQGQAVAGRGAEAFREALKGARRQIEALRRRAAELLAEGGKPPGAAVVERVGTDLEALAFSPAAAAQGARGYLDADLDPPGFEVLAGVRLAAPSPRTAPAPPTPPTPPAAAKPSRLLQFKKPPAETRAEAAARKRAEAAAARRARAVAKQRERVERAAAALGQATEKAAALRGEADAADRQAAAARRQATLAERAAATARRHAEAAEAEVARAQERLAAERAGSGAGGSES